MTPPRPVLPMHMQAFAGVFSGGGGGGAAQKRPVGSYNLAQLDGALDQDTDAALPQLFPNPSTYLG